MARRFLIAQKGLGNHRGQKKHRAGSQTVVPQCLENLRRDNPGQFFTGNNGKVDDSVGHAQKNP